MPTNNSIIKTFFKRIFRNRHSVLATNSLLKVVIWVLEREKSRPSHIGWKRWLLDDIRWVFGQKFIHNDSLVRWSFGTSRAAMRFMPEKSFEMVRIDSWDTESSAANSLKVVRTETQLAQDCFVILYTEFSQYNGCLCKKSIVTAQFLRN